MEQNKQVFLNMHMRQIKILYIFVPNLLEIYFFW